MYPLYWEVSKEGIFYVLSMWFSVWRLPHSQNMYISPDIAAFFVVSFDLATSTKPMFEEEPSRTM